MRKIARDEHALGRLFSAYRPTTTAISRDGTRGWIGLASEEERTRFVADVQGAELYSEVWRALALPSTPEQGAGTSSHSRSSRRELSDKRLPGNEHVQAEKQMERRARRAIGGDPRVSAGITGALYTLRTIGPLIRDRIKGAHWAASDDAVEVAINPAPAKSPVAYVYPRKYKDYTLNPDVKTDELCVEMLRGTGLKARADPTFDWIHDTYLILIRMFLDGCPPTTIVSMNPRFDPHYHMRVGLALQPLREEG
ncbi:aromatic ring-opening dioxygenase family protein [Niveomyces insectorum RCEF 264]|uniref:Aromatic ring-opening dioxygenase family protein n=1 Tax=Niveomyces insectorum RCEF 264 TaxID=1081102 RepID=A0A167Z029_9HYPO|nr:aromatic ring-opening dioxygenase family protein [Niveomyces insectorum RCEF 264]